MVAEYARRLLIVISCAASMFVRAQDDAPRAQPGLKWTDEKIEEAVAPMRVGRKLTPKSWPNDARVAVCLSWDMDNEAFDLATGVTEPITLSAGEYGAAEALPRIMELYDRYDIPGTFFVPAVTGLLYPELVAEIKRRPRHEIGIHGWIHEDLVALNDGAEEGRLLRKAVDFWTSALGKRPLGYRAPKWAYSKYTFDLIRNAGFEYDSSAMGMDEPYELNSHGQPTGLVELPVQWTLDDAAYFMRLPPEVVFKIFQDEFDVAYKEHTLFVLTMHPMFTGHRSSIMYLDRLIGYIKSKPGVWFATGRQIAEYVKLQRSASSRGEEQNDIKVR